MSPQLCLWIAGIAFEIATCGILVYRRIWSKLPFFSIYAVWCLISDIMFYLIANVTPVAFNAYEALYVMETAVNSTLQFCVLVELAVSSSQPTRARPNLRLISIIAFTIFACGAAIWPLIRIQGINNHHPFMMLAAQLQQTVSVLRILIFLLLAACSQWLAISWKNRELQVATGLGAYSLVSLAVSIAQMRQTSWARYSLVGELVSIAYLLTLGYWIVSFSRKEAERRELPASTRQALQRVAGQARIGREAAISTLQKPLD